MSQITAQGFRLVLAASAVGVLTSNAHAYLDPGTGSIILQVLLGGVAGLALAGKLYWAKFLSLIGVRKSEEPRFVETQDGGPADASRSK